ncbi:hypothetical protein ATK30_4280 [Amycolatopsis echigonensis]|uniref:Lipoprotein n=1 Tax=Amycolatopsis echigonensis TaxID=2576905 RepID=A0A2N3WHT6_9PSEU|nr:hypothetical protein [Amycolatopsis niigatensis]PKV93433.1 hypothetical protein ATK30_4280 [Amycolatopsis niigatensis]
MRTAMPVVLAVSATAMAFALSGCSSSSEGSTPAIATPPASSAAASSAAPSSSSAAASSAAEYTKQGTKLKIGEKAVVPFKSQKNAGAIGVTVTGIDKGAEADLAPLKLGDRAKGMTPYYIQVKVTNETGSDFSYSSLGLMNGLLADGTSGPHVTVIGKFEKCDSGNSGKAFTTKGASYDSCVLALAPAGAEVKGASYSASTYRDLAPETDYGKDAVTWQ